MECVKLLLVISAFVVLAQASFEGRNDAHNIDDCPDPSDQLKPLTNEPVYVAGEFLQIVKYVYRYPKQGVNRIPIKCILVHDGANDGTGAYPVIKAGGYNEYYIEIEFTSQLSHSIEFNVELLGQT